MVIKKGKAKMNFHSTLELTALDIREDVSTLNGRTFRLLCYLADIINRYLDIQLNEVGISRTNYDILHVLALNRGSLTSTELCRHVFRSKHAITRAIDVLEAEGLVIRRPHDSPDRRLKKVNLTEKGLLQLKNLKTQRETMHKQFLSCFDDKQIEEVGLPLRKLRDHLLKQINKT